MVVVMYNFCGTGMQHDVIFGDEPYGLPLEEKLLPQYLNPLGYHSHIVGKVSGVHRSVVMAMPCIRGAGMQHHVILGQNPMACCWRSLSCFDIVTHWDAAHIVWVGWEVCGIPLT